MSKGVRRDLVLVEFSEGERPYLFEAPSYTFKIELGTYVLVPSKRQKYSVGKVVGRLFSVSEASKEWDFVIAATKATLPLVRLMGYFETLVYEANECETPETIGTGEEE